MPDPIFIIAEAGVNHNGSLDHALELVDAASAAGADAVKFQTFKADRIATGSAPKARYQLGTTMRSESQRDMLRKLELDPAAHRELIRRCRQKRIAFLSTPFDLESLHLLVKILKVPRIKISSGDVTNAPLLLEAARFKKPVILSTGMATLGEIEEALGVLAFGYLREQRKPALARFREAFGSAPGREALEANVILLHCTTEYPAPFHEVNLRAMDTLGSAFGLPIGYSDHTDGITVAVAAAARGAVVIEKHFTLDRLLPGPDHKASLEPGAFRYMVEAIRQVERALGSPLKAPSAGERVNRPIVRKSVVAARAIRRGEPFSEENLAVKRPGTGPSPMTLWKIIGRRAARDYSPDEVIDL
jgi:N-acetylneuraminate synthase